MLPAEAVSKAIWIYGFAGYTDFSSHKHKKMVQWIDQKPDARLATNYVFVDSLPRAIRKWLAPSRIFHWREIDSQKLPKVVNESNREVDLSGRPRGTYDTWSATDGHKHHVDAGDLDTKKTMFYARKNDEIRWSLVKKFWPDALVVRMPQNRFGKFQRDFPNAKRMDETTLRNEAVKWIKDLPKDDLKALSVHFNHVGYRYREFEADRIDDPDVVEYLGYCTNHEDLKSFAQNIRQYVHIPTVDVKDPFSKYPLVEQLRYGLHNPKIRNEVYIYMNAAYAAKEEVAS